MCRHRFDFPAETERQIQAIRRSTGYTLSQIVILAIDKIFITKNHVEDMSGTNQSPGVQYDTLQAAETAWINSGVHGWQWFEGFDSDNLVEYLYRQSDGIKTFDDLIRGFLTMQGENIEEYSL